MSDLHKAATMLHTISLFKTDMMTSSTKQSNKSTNSSQCHLDIQNWFLGPCVTCGFLSHPAVMTSFQKPLSDFLCCFAFH